MTLTSASDRPRSDRVPSCRSTPHGGCARGRASVGPRWWRIDGQCLVDRASSPAFCARVGCGQRRSDHSGRRRDRRPPPRSLAPAASTTASDILFASPHPPTASDWSQRIRRVVTFRSGRWRTTGGGRARSSPPLRMRPICATGGRGGAEWMGAQALRANAVARYRRRIHVERRRTQSAAHLAASSAAAMISLVLAIWSATGPMGTRPPSDPTGPVRAGAQRKGCRQAVGSGSRWLSGPRPSIRPTSR